MPTSVGPNPSLDSNIIFSYDVGDTLNSYKGEPTVNYWDGVQYSVYNQDATNYRNQSTPLPPTPGYEVVKVVSNTPGSYGHSILWKAPYPNNNVATITNSIYAWLESGTYVQVGQHWFPWYYGTQKYIPAGQWVRISETYAINEGNSYGVAALTYSTDGVAYFTMPQYEYKSHITPYIGASQTRSATQGLLPLVSNSTINLSNVSFDSNAQIYFDGTDDYIDIANNSSLQIVDNITIEIVAKINSSNIGDIKVIANKYSGTGWELLLDSAGKFSLNGRNGDGTYYVSNSQTVVANNNYYHLVAIKSGLLWQTYVNGNLTSSTTATSIGTLSNSAAMQIGREGPGYYPSMYLPIFKVYNVALSPDQVKQNYNQYKSRFNLS
jgi:hypothetical protein